MAVNVTALRWSTNGDVVFHAEAKTAAGIVLPGDTDDKSQVVSLSKLGEIPVNDGHGKSLGRIVDFAIASRSGLIAYGAMTLDTDTSTDRAIYPVPLAAFVVPKEAQQWVLELPAGTLEHTPHFEKGKWPHSVPLAWMEYVRERYGRSPFGGVERKRHQN